MNIVYSSSDLFSEITAVSIASLLKNSQGEKIHFFIINNGIKSNNQERLKTLVHSYDQLIDFLPLPDIEKIVGRKINVGRWNISTFGRCFLCSILPENIDRIIFIDADTIVRHSLSGIYHMDMGEKVIYGVDDCRGGSYRKNIDLPSDHEYINCGFMLINLKRWRELKLEQECINFINDKNGDITYMDQGVINGVFGKRELVGLIPPWYNAQRLYFDFSYQEFVRLRKPSFHYSEEEYGKTIMDPVVVHFTTCFISGTRPWNEEDHHPLKQEFLIYHSMTPWSEMPFWPDDRKRGKKFMTMICNFLPRKMMIYIISYVHVVLYPMVRNIKMRKHR